MGFAIWFFDGTTKTTAEFQTADREFGGHFYPRAKAPGQFAIRFLRNSKSSQSLS